MVPDIHAKFQNQQFIVRRAIKLFLTLFVQNDLKWRTFSIKSFGSHLFCVNIRALVSASITCCQIRMAGHYSCQIRIVGMLIARRRYCQQLLSLILPRCRFVYANTFLTFLSNWSRDRIHPILCLDSSYQPHVTRAYQSVIWKMLE